MKITAKGALGRGVWRRRLAVLSYAAAAAYLLANARDIYLLVSQNLAQCATLLALSVLPVGVNAIRFYSLTRLFACRLSVSQWFGLSVCNTMYNFILPAKGGTIARAVYMKNALGFGYADYVSMTLTGFLLNAFAAVMAIGLFSLFSPPDHPMLRALGYASALAAAAVLLLLPFKKRFPFDKFLPATGRFAVLARFGGGLSAIGRRPLLALALVALQLGFVFLSTLRLWFAFRIVGVHLSLPEMIFIQMIINLVLVVSLTPGNLGVWESLTAALTFTLGAPIETSMLAAVLDRVASVVVVFSIGLYCSRLLFKSLDKAHARADEKLSAQI